MWKVGDGIFILMWILNVLAPRPHSNHQLWHFECEMIVLPKTRLEKHQKEKFVFWLIFDLCNKLIFRTRKESKIWYIEKGRWRRIRLKKSNQDIIQQIFMQPMTSETWKGEWIHSRITLGRTIYQVNLFYL